MSLLSFKERCIQATSKMTRIQRHFASVQLQIICSGMGKEQVSISTEDRVGFSESCAIFAIPLPQKYRKDPNYYLRLSHGKK